MTLLLLACDDEPMLSAVAPPPTAAEVAKAREERTLAASPAAVEAGYRKAQGVYVDVRYLGGRTWDAVRGDVAEQLGTVVEERPLPDGDLEVQLDRGTVRVREGRILMVDVPLPEDLGRTEALAALGFPPAVHDYIASTFEYRLTNAWGFRRILFVRAERGSERIERVQAWHKSPGDG